MEPRSNTISTTSAESAYDDPSKEEAQKFPLANLPNEMLASGIGPFLSGNSFLNLRRVSHRFDFLSGTPEYKKILEPLRRLLDNGALGELEQAENIWRAFPDLLTYSGTIYHPNRIYVEGEDPIDIPFDQNPGRYKYINRTFYKILLMNSEFEEAEKIGTLMTQEEKQKQFDEIFPDGEIKKYNFDLGEAKKILQVLFDAVAKDESIKIERDADYNIKNIIMSDSTQKALHALYLYAKPKSEHDIGLVFDPEFYHEALKLYDEKCGQFKQKWDRYSFWNICVEEWLAGCLGTGYLRPHAQGMGNKQTRSGCVLVDGSSYFAFRRSSLSLPGAHFFVGYRGGERSRRLLRTGGGMSWPLSPVLTPHSFHLQFSKLMSSKNESKDRLYAAICAPRNGLVSNLNSFNNIIFY